MFSVSVSDFQAMTPCVTSSMPWAQHLTGQAARRRGQLLAGPHLFHPFFWPHFLSSVLQAKLLTCSSGSRQGPEEGRASRTQGAYPPIYG